MGATEPGSAREEAERLVAAVLGAARLATAGVGEQAGGLGPVGEMISSVLSQVGEFASTGPAPERAAGATTATPGFATGTAECCICPICRTIATLRDPSPEFAERIATGAGDLAAGVASLLRAFSSGPSGPFSPDPSGPAGTGPSGPRSESDTSGPPGPGARSAQPSGWTDSDDEVWREATRTRHDSGPAPERDVWAKATYADVDPRPTVPASRAPGEPVTAEEDAPGDVA